MRCNTLRHGNPTPTVCDGLTTAYRDNKCTGVAAGLREYSRLSTGMAGPRVRLH